MFVHVKPPSQPAAGRRYMRPTGSCGTRAAHRPPGPVGRTFRPLDPAHEWHLDLFAALREVQLAGWALGQADEPAWAAWAAAWGIDLGRLEAVVAAASTGTAATVRA